MGFKQHDYGAMPRVKETFASYLSLESALPLKAPTLPTKPLRATSTMVGKAYSAAGQAAACQHTMTTLLTYQAELLRDIDEGGEPSTDVIKELRQAADLSLWATKEMARSISHFMAALVAMERDLWLNLSGIKDKDKSFLLDAPLSLLGLIGDAVNSVTTRFQEAKKQAAVFQKFLPLHSQVSGAAKWEQPQLSASSSHRAKQKQDIAARSPHRKTGGLSTRAKWI